MEAVRVVCPTGLFPLPAHAPFETLLPTIRDSAPLQQQQQLLDHLQVLKGRCHRLLDVLSVQNYQGADDLDHDVCSLLRESCTYIQQCLQQAAAAKQPLLSTSSQHSSCFCQLLERLRMLDNVSRAALQATSKAAVTASDPHAAQQPTSSSLHTAEGRVEVEAEHLQNVEQAEPSACERICWISQLEQQLQALPGIDMVLAALVQHCQQNMAAGASAVLDLTSTATDGRGRVEVIDVTCLSSIQEQHSSARALPLLLRLYFTNSSRLEALAAGKPEALSSKLLEKCLTQIAVKPVMPGHGGMPVVLSAGLEACRGLAEVASARKLKLPAGLPSDTKALSKLDESYSLEPLALPLLQQHDRLCDLLSQLALEVRQSVAVERDVDSKALGSAEELVVGSINFVSAARDALLELHAWRCMQQQQQQQQRQQQQQQPGGSNQPRASSESFVLADRDIVPFMDILGAVKGLAGLVTDSNEWLLQLLIVSTVKQLQEFASSALPALTKQYPRNERIQHLLRSAMSSMQGQLIELTDEIHMACTPPAVSPAPVTPTYSQRCAASPLPAAAGPVAEGFEGLKPRWGKKGQKQVEPSEAQERRRPQSEEESLQQMMKQAAEAAAETAAETAAEAAGAAEYNTSRTLQQHLENAWQQQQQQQQHQQDDDALEEQYQVSDGHRTATLAAVQDSDELSMSADAVQQLVQQQQQPTQGKKGWSNVLMDAMRKGKQKPQPSPAPELCAAPAALAALEEMLSGAEAECYAAKAAAAAAEEGTISSTPQADEMRARLQQDLVNLEGQSTEPGSVYPSNPSTMSIMTAAVNTPPDLPWEQSSAGQQQSPSSVAEAAAAFERLAAAKRASRLSATQTGMAAAAASAAALEGTQPADKDILDLQAAAPDDLDPEELAAAAALELALAEEGHLEATTAELEAVCNSPQTARNFHLFKFRSLLQHHEKLSSTGTSDLLAAVEDNSKQPNHTAAVELGAVARMRAVLSMRRRTSAAGLASAVSAALQQPVDARDMTADSDCDMDRVASVPPPSAAAAGAGDSAPCDLPDDGADAPASLHGAADADQPTKQGKVAVMMSRMIRFRPQAREQQGQAAEGGTAGKGMKALNFTAKLKKVVERRQAGTGGLDNQYVLQVNMPPPLTCLLQLRVILEQLMHEIKTETKKHLMVQLQMAAAAAAGSAGAKPDASIARPLKQVKALIKAVHSMQLALDYVRHLEEASDLSTLWVSRACSSTSQEQESADPAPAPCCGTAADEQPPSVPGNVLHYLLSECTDKGAAPFRLPSAIAPSTAPAVHQKPEGDAAMMQSANGCSVSFPMALLTSCMCKLDSLPADLPLLTLHIIWDVRHMLREIGLLDSYLHLLYQQEEACLRCYMTSLVSQAYEHFKRLSAHQTVTYEVLRSCDAPCLQPVRPIYLDALLREPCTIMLQADYTATAQAAEAELSQHEGGMLPNTYPTSDLGQWPGALPQSKQQEAAFDNLQQALQQLLSQQAECEGQKQPEVSAKKGIDPGLGDHQQESTAALPASAGSKLLSHASPQQLSPSKADKQRKRRNRTRQRAAGDDDDSAARAGAVPPGLTPLMQKVEQLSLTKHAAAAQQLKQVQELARAQAASLLDVRQWLLAGLLILLKKDAADLVGRCRHAVPMIVVEAHLQHDILQRTHQLISQYAPLPCSWQQLWREADAVGMNGEKQTGCDSAAAQAIAGNLLQLLNTAAYDSEARVLLPPAAAATATYYAEGVLGEVSAAVKPLRGFFGRQHLDSLLRLAGPAGQQHVLTGLLDKVEQEQETLLKQLQELQSQLPAALLQLPPAEQYHDAGSVLDFYQSQLSQAISDPIAYSASLDSLQRIGNCLALLHLMSTQQSVQATPVFMQAAPFLGIVGRPITDAAVAAECFEVDGLPPPPDCTQQDGVSHRSCAPGLLMPEIERLEPTHAARQAYEVQVGKEVQQEQAWRDEAAALGVPFDSCVLKPGGDLARHRVWQNSHFQRLLLGPDADKVRGPALLLTQTAELAAWEATQAAEYMGACLQRVQLWVTRLQHQLQGIPGDTVVDVRVNLGAMAHNSNTAVVLGSTARTPTANPPLPQDISSQQSDQQPRELTPEELSAQDVVQPTRVSADVVAVGDHDDGVYQQQLPRMPVQDQSPAAQPIAAQLGLQQTTAEPSAARAPAAADSACNAALSRVRAGGNGIAHKGMLAMYCTEDVNSPLLTPDVQQLESCAPHVAPLTAAASTADSGNLQIRTKMPSHMSTEDLEAAAEAVAASQPGSPQSGNPPNPWLAAGAAAAQLPAGSVPPAQAKLAYRALLGSNPQQDSAQDATEDCFTDRPLTGGSASGRCGLAELVVEALDVVTSARSDIEQPVSSRLLSSRQTQVQPEQEASAGRGVEYAETSEAASPRRRRTRSRAGVGGGRDRAPSAGGSSKQASPPKHLTVGLDSGLEDASDDMNDSDHDAADCGPANFVGAPHAGGQHSSRLGQLSSGGAAEKAAAVGATTSSSPDTSPASSRRAVPRLGLDAISNPPSRSGPVAEKHVHTRGQQQGLIAQSRVGQTCSRPSRGAEGGASSSQGPATVLDTIAGAALTLDEGQRGASYQEDELLDGTCAELMRVKMERDEYRSEIEVLKNQLKNQEQTITLLSGDFYTPRTTDSGSGLGSNNYLDKEHSTGALQQHGVTVLGDHPSAGNMQLEASVAGRSSTEAGAAANMASKGSPSQLHGIPEVASAQLSPEQLNMQQEALKLSVRVQQPSFADAGDGAVEEHDDSSSSSEGPDSEDSSTDFSSVVGKFKLPEAVSASATRRGDSITPNTAQLAVALSALKFALLLEAAQASQATADSAAAAPAAGSLQTSELVATPQNSPLKRLKKVTLSKVTGGTPAADASSNVGDVGEQPIKAGEFKHAERLEAISSNGRAASATAASTGTVAAASASQYCGGSGRIAGGRYGDGPLLASAVLLQLSGQSRKHALLDATDRITHWVEYDAVKGSRLTNSSASAAGKGLAAGFTTAGGIDPNTAEGIAPPEPRSRKRQEEQAEQDARLKQKQAAQQQLLQRLAAAARQADRVAHDGCSIAARFAPPAPAHSQKLRLRVYRADRDALGEAEAAEVPDTAPGLLLAGQNAAAAKASGKWVRFSSTGSRGRSSTASGSGSTPKQCTSKAVPMRSEMLEFSPAVKPWSDIVPCNSPIGTHPQLPMPRPRPLLLPDHLAATAFNTRPAGAPPAAGDNFANPAGRLIPATGVTPGAGLVAAARAVHAREAMLAAMPRAAVYSFSVMSDHNRSGRPDDGYSKAPSSLEYDSLEGSPRKHSVLQHSLAAAAAAVHAGAARLGGRGAGAAADRAVADQFGQGGLSGSGASSPSRSPTKSPSRRVGTSALQLRLAGQQA